MSCCHLAMYSRNIAVPFRPKVCATVKVQYTFAKFRLDSIEEFVLKIIGATFQVQEGDNRARFV